MKTLYMLLTVLLLTVTSVYGEDEPLNLPPTSDLDGPILLYLLPNGKLVDSFDAVEEYWKKRAEEERKRQEKGCTHNVDECKKLSI